MNITIQKFFLFLDKIDTLEELENNKLLLLFNYTHLKNTDDADKILFPSKSKRSYWDYEDDGQGIEMLKQLTKR